MTCTPRIALKLLCEMKTIFPNKKVKVKDIVELTWVDYNNWETQKSTYFRVLFIEQNENTGVQELLILSVPLLIQWHQPGFPLRAN